MHCSIDCISVKVTLDISRNPIEMRLPEISRVTWQPFNCDIKCWTQMKGVRHVIIQIVFCLSLSENSCLAKKINNVYNMYNEKIKHGLWTPKIITRNWRDIPQYVPMNELCGHILSYVACINLWGIYWAMRYLLWMLVTKYQEYAK